MSRRVSLLARVDQIVAKGDWSRERAQQRQAHHVHTRTSDKRGKRLLGTQATIEYHSHQPKKQDKAPKTPQNAEDARRLDDAQVVRRKAGSAFASPHHHKRSNIALFAGGTTGQRGRATSAIALMRRAAPHLAEQVLDDADFETTVAKLDALHGAHGEAVMRRLKQFLTITRSARAGLEARDDDGDPGLARFEDGVDVRMRAAVPSLEVMAWLWRYLEREFERQHGREPLDEHAARWTKHHEHQFLLFRGGCDVDKEEKHVVRMSDRVDAGPHVLHKEDFQSQSHVKPVNLMLNFISARTEVVRALDGRAKAAEDAHAPPACEDVKPRSPTRRRVPVDPEDTESDGEGDPSEAIMPKRWIDPREDARVALARAANSQLQRLISRPLSTRFG